MSVIQSYFVRKSVLFGRSCDSEWSVFDKTRYLEQVRGILAHDNISEPGKLRINDRLEDLVGRGRRCGWRGTGAGRCTEY